MEGLDANRAPRFRLITEKFEDIQIIGQRQPSMHGANTMAVFDVDGDGDPDILWAISSSPACCGSKPGTCAHFDFHGERIPFPPGAPLETSGYNAPAAGDLNGDGRLDLVVGVLGGAFNPVKTSTANLYELDQTASGSWTLATTHLLDAIDLGAETIPHSAISTATAISISSWGRRSSPTIRAAAVSTGSRTPGHAPRRLSAARPPHHTARLPQRAGARRSRWRRPAPIS